MGDINDGRTPSRCSCVGVEMGSYSNQETVETPSGKIAGIDRCVLDDVRRLWVDGLETIESCCGHGKVQGYIAVPAHHRDAMISRGWTPDSRTPQPGIFAWPSGS